ncbi:hypothetical protein [Cellulomonas fimi]|uniref:hypothetical protein n=1 Tax=Cellulomonas fimi TaxID=1708 RepID=UPI002358C7A2|nr:hypothetical protein [Cellulomonas fimi]
MSTSDPHRPSADEAPDASTTGTPATTDSPTTTDTPAAPGTDTGRHAVVRPAPTPPPETGAATTGETFTPATGSSPGPRTDTPAPTTSPTTARTAPDPTAGSTPAPPPAPATTAAGAGGTTAAAPATTAPRTSSAADDESLFPAPNAPRSTSFGAHVLGAIVGLLLAPAGVGLVLVGQARILEAQVDGWDGSTEVLGIVLVSIGLLLLGLVALLAIWSAAVPIAGGALLTAAGGFYLFAPSVARAQTLAVLDDTGWRLTVTQVTVAGTSGTLLVAGFLVLLVGVVAAVARRRGVHLGEFRERHRV